MSDEMVLAIEAAGTIPWRINEIGEVEVAIVHRPRYDDWSFPKGKLDRGEEIIACAYRETLEETGFDTKLGVYIGQIEYFTPDGLKKVSYWAAQLKDGQQEFKSNSEVDQLLWVEIDTAEEKLTRVGDREILAKFADAPIDTTPLILLRHAKALVRSEWTGDDDDRPLEGIGQVQAQRMLSIYQAYGLTEIHTSDAIRCYDTVAAMARALGIEMTVTRHLSETTFKKNKDKALDYAKDLSEAVADQKQPILLCSHNPILPRALERITKKSDVELPEEKLQPGDAWVVHIRKKKVHQIDLIKAPYSGTN